MLGAVKSALVSKVAVEKIRVKEIAPKKKRKKNKVMLAAALTSGDLKSDLKQ